VFPPFSYSICFALGDTFNTISPEIFKNREPFDGELVDVWTLGAILFCMLTGNRSYQQVRLDIRFAWLSVTGNALPDVMTDSLNLVFAQPHPSDAQFYWMTHGLPQLLADWSVSLSPEGVDLLQKMLQVNPKHRINLGDIERHP
jgi:serine/threonine protein kinase